jgi:dTDP-4-dehydrorhamnose reductase
MITKKIIIIGGDSFIGKKIIFFFQKKKIDFLATSKKKKKNFIYLDLKYQKNFFVKYNAEFVIFCAGITDINFCEKNKLLTKKINVDYTKLFLDKCIKRNIHIIYFSTDRIYKSRNFDNKLTAYAKHKITIEKFLKRKANFYTIFRLGKIVHGKMSLYVKWRKQLLNKLKIQVLNNYYYYNTNINKLINTIYYIIKKRNHLKIVNLYNKKPSSYFNLAQNFLKERGYNKSSLKKYLITNN